MSGQTLKINKIIETKNIKIYPTIFGTVFLVCSLDKIAPVAFEELSRAVKRTDGQTTDGSSLCRRHKRAVIKTK
jgi:hypothetical protein